MTVKISYNLKGRWWHRMKLDQVRHVLETFEMRQNEFTWDNASVKEAMDVILDVIDIDFKMITFSALLNKLKNVGFCFAHRINSKDGLSNGVIIIMFDQRAPH
jgi:hypothetical protein